MQFFEDLVALSIDARQPPLGAPFAGLLHHGHGHVVAAVAVGLRLADEAAFRGIDPDPRRVVDVVGDLGVDAVEFRQLAGEVDVGEKVDFGAGDGAGDARAEQGVDVFGLDAMGLPAAGLEGAPGEVRRGAP